MPFCLVYINTVFISQCSYFRTEDSNDNVLNIPVGNATLDTEFLYEYGVRTAKLTTKESKPG